MPSRARVGSREQLVAVLVEAVDQRRNARGAGDMFLAMPLLRLKFPVSASDQPTELRPADLVHRIDEASSFAS
jgi:hypothetical protein